MRKSTVLWLVLAVVCGTMLYYTSQKVHDSREKIAVLAEQVTREQETIRVLTAEWSYLTQPKRLEKLSKEHLKLSPLKGRQFSKVDELPMRGVEVKEEVKAEIAETPPAVITAPPVVIEKRVSIAPLQNDKAVKTAQDAPQKAAPPKKPAPKSARTFGDVMKSLEGR